MALTKYITETFNTTHRRIFPIPEPMVGESGVRIRPNLLSSSARSDRPLMR